MATTTYSPPHPIVFVFDFSNKNVAVPEYDSNAVTSANESCVSIRTIADVDGEVTVNLVEALPCNVADIGFEVFCGTINAPGRKVALVTSQNEKLLEETGVAVRH